MQVSPESDIFSTTKTNESQQCIVQVRAETTVTPKPQYTEMLKHNVLSISTDKYSKKLNLNNKCQKHNRVPVKRANNIIP